MCKEFADFFGWIVLEKLEQTLLGCEDSGNPFSDNWVILQLFI